MKMMKYALYLILVLVGLTFNQKAMAAAGFIDGLEDVPVMEGLSQLPNDAISFGNEESRLVEAILVGENSSFAKVEKFYKDTLPQMGWSFQGKKSSSLIFYRDRESREITQTQANPLKIRITVKSKN